MSNLPLHPAIVHLPLGLAFVLPLLALTLLIAVGLGRLPRRAWLLAALLQATVVLSAVAAMRTGEADEERVEERVSESLIEAHEERAEAFTWSAGLTLALLLGAGLSPWLGRALGGLSTAAAFASAGLAVAVGHAGGEIVHGEQGLSGSLAASDAVPAPGDATDPVAEGAINAGDSGLGDPARAGGEEEEEDEDEDD